MSNQIEPSWANYMIVENDEIKSFHENKPTVLDGQSLYLTDRADRKLSHFISSLNGKENEERFDQFFSNVVKPRVEAMLLAKKMELKDLTFDEIADITAEYVLHEHYQTMIAI